MESASNALLNCAHIDEEDPKSVAETMQSKLAKRWKEAIYDKEKPEW